MIRQATKYDKTWVTETMKMFRDESPIKEICNPNNEQYWDRFLDEIISGKGTIFVDDNRGLLLAAILPSIWDNQILVAHELAWYVLPQYRGSSTGYRLLKRYIDWANDCKRQGRIKYFTVSKMISSPDLDYSRFGFKKIDENWINA